MAREVVCFLLLYRRNLQALIADVMSSEKSGQSSQISFIKIEIQMMGLNPGRYIKKAV